MVVKLKPTLFFVSFFYVIASVGFPTPVLPCKPQVNLYQLRRRSTFGEIHLVT